MRAARDTELLIIDNNFIGINLGADYCAEHEWGIKDIQSYFSINESKLGLDKRKTFKTHHNLIWINSHKFKTYDKKDKSRWSGFYFDHRYDPRYGDTPYFAGSPYKKDIYAQWDSGGFCSLSSNPEIIEHLKKIYEAFATNDIAMWLGGGGPFKNRGLCIAIASHLPKIVTDDWYKYDVEHNQLMQDVKDSGIEYKLKLAGKRYHALSPSRKEDGSLTFFLNPWDQKNDNHGWVNLNDLNDWINGTGKIPKSSK